MASWRFESTDKNKLQVTEWSIQASSVLPHKQAIGGTDCSKAATFELPHNYNRIQFTWAAARNPQLYSLTIKEATGDMDCMQASFGLSIKTGYR